MHDGTSSTLTEWIIAFADRWKSVATIVFTAVLAVFTVGLYRVNSDYANTARQSQRPWIGVVKTDPLIFTFAANQPVDVGLVYRNFGASPGLRVAAIYQVVIGDAPPTKDSEWTDDTAPTDLQCVSKADKEFGVPVFPEHENEYLVNRLSFDQRPSFSDLDVKAVLAGNKGLYVTGCFVYRDGAGNAYHTYLCLYYTTKPGSMQYQFGYCPIGNRVE